DSICFFCYSILLGAVPNSVLAHNPSICCKFSECIGHIFTSLVITKIFDFASSMVLCISFEILKCCKDPILALEWIDDTKSREVINEGNPVEESRCRFRQRSFHIRVYKLKE